MGYYTRYELTVHDDLENDILAELRESNDSANFALDTDGGTNEECKWYDHEKDMKSFSKKYPNTLFEMKGEGEEGSEDMWIKYFMNGEMQIARAKIEYDDFDQNKLE